MAQIKIQLKEGAPIEVAAGTPASESLAKLPQKLRKKIVVARADIGNGMELIDLARPLDRDTQLEFLTTDDPDGLYVFRHSSAHLLAAAVLELYPDTKLGIGPPIDQGFFYEFLRETPFTPDDLVKIEKRMGQLRDKKVPNVRKEMPFDDAIKMYEQQNQSLKCEIIRDKSDGKTVQFYESGDFTDFCLGPHIPDWGRVKAFKLLSVAGAYWKGEEGNPQMQRVYGTAFPSQAELDDHLEKLEQAKLRDHRRLGKQLDLFSIQEEGGAGLIFWHPKGGIIRHLMETWLRDEVLKRGYELVYTPHAMRQELWKTSGHLDFYRESMFPAMEDDKVAYQLKPMNCPGHILIYKSGLRSYRDLPIRYAELGTVYRWERAGVLHGLLRVRGFTQDDAHIFCTPDQIVPEIEACVRFALDLLKTYGFDKYEVELSVRDPNDPDKYAGSAEDWDRAEASLSDALGKMQIPFKRMEGEAVFYGPKIDIKLIDAIGRPWQLSTVQFDFNLPERFQMEYVAADGARHRPLMVHRALYGSVERFFGVLIEHYAGAFPAWLAPVQVAVLPISEKVAEYAKKVADELRSVGFRVELDDRNEKIGAKIRDAQMQKVPFMLICGKKEEEKGLVSVRSRSKGDLGPAPLGEFIADLRERVESKSHDT